MRNDGGNSESTAIDYVSRVNRAIDFIVANLDKPHRLDDLAGVAHFSPFHFHRVFQAMVGETPTQFAKRLRLERALTKMCHDKNRSLTDIALSCGFSSSADFSRSFKQRYGVAPSAFDIETWRSERRGELDTLMQSTAESLHVTRLPEGENPDGFVATVKSIEPRTVAYIRVLDPYNNGTKVTEAAERLVLWAESRGAADSQWLGYMWEDPEVTPLKDCRYDVAVVVDEVEPDGEIGRYQFPAMRVAEVRMSGGIDLEIRALDWLYRTWLPNSGYVPDDLPGFEAWAGRPFEHGFEHFELSLQLPVTKSR